MFYIGYLIIVDCHNIKKNQFWEFPLLSCRGWKTALAGCAQPLWEPPLTREHLWEPPLTPEHPNGVKNT